MAVALPVDHPQAGPDRVHIQQLADQTWVEDNHGSAALLQQHATRAGFTAHIDLAAADLSGKVALVATGHAVALIPGVLTPSIRADVTTVALVDAPTRGIYAVTPRHNGHPSSAPLLDQIAAAFGPPH
jgi:DNA-binding transcriptional LysR family regulator